MERRRIRPASEALMFLACKKKAGAIPAYFISVKPYLSEIDLSYLVTPGVATA